MVKKKDGSLRFCVNFRQLNAATIKDAHPIPLVDDLLDALNGARWFTILDLKSGYWQVPIQEQDKEKTAFRTSSGQLFEFNQVPFGLCNAPATFSRLMDRVLGESTGKPASSTWTTSLSSPPRGKSTLPASDKSSSDSATPSSNSEPRSAHLRQRRSAISATGLPQKASPDPTLLAAIREIAPPPQNSHGSLLIFGPRRILPALYQEFRRHCQPSPCSHQERCSLPLGSRVSRRLRPPQDPPHHQPNHCIPGLHPPISAIHRCLHRRPGSYPRASARKKGAHHLLCLALP